MITVRGVVTVNDCGRRKDDEKKDERMGRERLLFEMLSKDPHLNNHHQVLPGHHITTLVPSLSPSPTLPSHPSTPPTLSAVRPWRELSDSI